MSDVVASLAVTLDMYVSRPDGSVDYLDKFTDTDYDFDAFAATIGGLVMGSASYEQAAGWGWMWGDRPTVVMTTRSGLPVPDGADVTFSSGSTADEVRALAALLSLVQSKGVEIIEGAIHNGIRGDHRLVWEPDGVSVVG